ncbi:hypothetical protein VTN96DRAFT_2096 [Rasamsonia emersonii]
MDSVLTSLAIFLAVLVTAAQGLTNVNYCPLLGPAYPAPTNLSTSAAFATAKANITNVLTNYAQPGRNSSATGSVFFDANKTSFTVEVFSVNEPEPLFQYYYTAPSLANATSGVKTVDENSVFRIGSLSKLWTVLLYLIEARDEGSFNDPVTKYITELRVAAADITGNATERQDPIDFVRWEEVTIGELASQLAGVARDYAFFDTSLPGSGSTIPGLPPLAPSEIPPCSGVTPCDRAQFFQGLLKRHPVVPTSSTPIYSNAAFQILGYVLEDIANQTYASILLEDIIRPLNLSRSSYTTPDDKYGVIPINDTASGWNLDLGDEGPAGSIYSSTKDMSTLGRAILSNTLLPPALTRRWMKPATYSTSLGAGVGAPWEIFSFQESGRTVDLYTKSGDVGVYAAITALIPDYNVGFTILAAGGDSTSIPLIFSDIIAANIIPALEQAGKEEANRSFSGTYAVTSGLNSSITITVDDGPGLNVDRWISNSTDMFASLAVPYGVTSAKDLSIRLYPTGLQDPSSSRISFRAVIQPLSSGGIGPFTQACFTWAEVDGLVYGSVGVDEFLFELNATGNAVSVSPRALRVTLPKV